RLWSHGMIVSGWHWLGSDGFQTVKEALHIAESLGMDDIPTMWNNLWEQGLCLQIRHLQKPAAVAEVEYLEPVPERSADYRIRIRFASPQRAVTPGQSMALWRGERCLGGGIVEDVLDELGESMCAELQYD